MYIIITVSIIMTYCIIVMLITNKSLLPQSALPTVAHYGSRKPLPKCDPFLEEFALGTGHEVTCCYPQWLDIHWPLKATH
jgi:hypothetical protein